jgi:L-aminopeptidase/D-esterase-like protein
MSSRHARPAPSGAITDVAGIAVGHFTETRRATGCTVIITEDGAVGGVDVRGAAPGTRETDLLDPANSAEQVHAVVLSGGSAFGLDAAAGVVRFLEERGIGLDCGCARVPIVPAAVLFDLALGDAAVRPDAAAGYAACLAAATAPPLEGNAGAGAGATVGKFFGMARAMKSGIGTASLTLDGFTVGAIVAVNAMGDVVDPADGRTIAGARSTGGEQLQGTVRALLRGERPAPLYAGTATTLGVVATDAVLTKAQAQRLARTAHDGLARAIDPVHTIYDGDTIFALGTGRAQRSANLALLDVMSAEATKLAVLRAVRAANGIPGFPAARDLSGAT